MATPPDETEEIDDADVEEVLEEDDEPESLAEEITDPAIQKEMLLAELGEQQDRKVNPLTAIAKASRENPEAIDALLDGLRMPSVPPPPTPEPEPPRTPTTLPAPPEEDEDPEEAAFYAAVTLPSPPPKPK